MTVETKLCPYCSEEIKSTAIKCKHCGSMLGDEAGEVSGTAPTAVAPPISGTTPATGAAPAWWSLAGPLEPGTEVREYRIEEMLGQGGMGEVYLAVHGLTGQKAAIKVVSPELMRDEGVRQRFIEEARVMAGLKHANIVHLLGFFEEGGRFFLVMEYIEGKTLDDVLERRPLSEDEARRIGCSVLKGLQFAHTRPQPVVHRDIKPANILLGKDGRVVITDFGVAKALGREKMTRAGGTVGTYEYMSPEQVRGEEVSPGSDLYSMGIVLYKMLTGVVPFPQKSETGIECMNAHLNSPVPPVAEFREGLSAWVQGVLESALAKEPGTRFASADAMAAAIKRSAAHKPAPAREATPPPAREATPPPPALPPEADVVHDPVPAKGSGKGLLFGGIAAAVVVLALLAVFVGPKVMPGGGQEPKGVSKEPEGWSKTEAGKKQAEEEQKKKEKARQEAELAEKIDGLKREGRAALDKGDYDKAIAEYAAAKEAGGDAEEIDQLVVKAEEKAAAERARVEAEKKAKEAEERRNKIEGFQQEGNRALADGDHDRARDFFRKAKEAGGDAVELDSLIARADEEEKKGPVKGVDRKVMLMVDVPAGTYTVGASKRQAQEMIDLCLVGTVESACSDGLFSDQSPPHVADISSFYLDKTEVSNSAYRQCVFAGRCSEPGSWSRDNFSSGNQPVVDVEWGDAVAFCQWAGKRLPTEAEWEYAAYGRSGGRYAWGDEAPRAGLATYCDAACVRNEYTVEDDPDRRRGPDPVWSNSSGASPDGVLNLSGNVWEWTADKYDKDYFVQLASRSPVRGPINYSDSSSARRVIKGAGWDDTPIYLDPRHRKARSPDAATRYLGFRCAANRPMSGMVRIPGGRFSRGRDEAALTALLEECMADAVLKKCSYGSRFADQVPTHRVTLSAFGIDAFPVTNGMYRKCHERGACKGEASLHLTGRSGEHQPVTLVKWDDAESYCESVGKRLCTEMEWEAAARGDTGALYPWGTSDITPDHAVYCSGACESVPSKARLKDGSFRPAEILSKGLNKSPLGVYDMVGNVLEWTASKYVGRPFRKCKGECKDPHKRVRKKKEKVVCKGGSYTDGPTKVTATYRAERYRNRGRENLGFRCCAER